MSAEKVATLFRANPFSDFRGFGRDMVAAGMLAYLKAANRMEVDLHTLPRSGPFLALTSHFSIFDTASLMAADPFYPRTTYPVKEEMYDSPAYGWALRLWGTLPVARDGNDREAVAGMIKILKEGSGLCIAAAGTRSKDGRLNPIDESLTRFAVSRAKKGIPVFPIVEEGTRDIFRKGRLPHLFSKIRVVSGEEIDLATFDTRTEDGLEGAARAIQGGFMALLTDESYHPAKDQKVIWRSSEYVGYK